LHRAILQIARRFDKSWSRAISNIKYKNISEDRDMRLLFCAAAIALNLVSIGLVAAKEVTINIPDDDRYASKFELKTTEKTAPQSPNAPVLLDITARTKVAARNGILLDVVPDFHFMAPNGNAIVIHRELIDTSGAIAQTQLRDATINIPAAAQKKGAVISGGWRCGTQQYYVTIRATILDSDGNRSNPMEYTIHCNGG
jgi:hypothetical protein